MADVPTDAELIEAYDATYNRMRTFDRHVHALRAVVKKFTPSPPVAAVPATPDCPRCQGSGEDPEGFCDQSRGPDGDTHDGPCRDCGGSGDAQPQPQPAQPLTGASWQDGINAAADMLAMKAERFAADHAYNDMGAISFGRGAHAEAKHDYYTSLLELESDVRAMLTAPSTPTPEVAP